MAYGVMMADEKAAVVTLVVSVAVVSLIKTFHKNDGVGSTYLAGLTLMLAAMAWPYVLLLMPVFLILLIRPLEAFSLRNVMAMLLGALTPLWLYLPYWLYVHVEANDWRTWPGDYWQSLLQVTPFDYAGITPLPLVVYGLLLLVFLLLTVRRSIFRFKGKQFVRSQRAMYITLTWIMVAVMPCFPTLSAWLLPLMAACIGPIAAQVMTRDGR